jgi:hypothetical protein
VGLGCVAVATEAMVYLTRHHYSDLVQSQMDHFVTRQQSTLMKLDTVGTMALIIRFALSFLWFVVKCDQRKAIVMVSLMSDD